MPKKRKAARQFSRDLTAEQIRCCLHYFGADADLMDTCFSSDAECLRVWVRHREALMREWAGRLAAGREAPGSIPWGLALERGWTMR
jgi:hypothetical protein